MTAIPEYDDILDSLFHNADYRIMPTENLVIWFFGTFPWPLGSPLAKLTMHNPVILSFGGTQSPKKERACE